VIVGVPREIKPGEERVALTPAGVRALVQTEHRVRPPLARLAHQTLTGPLHEALFRFGERRREGLLPHATDDRE